MLQKEFIANDHGTNYTVMPRFALYMAPQNIALELFIPQIQESYAIVTINVEGFNGYDKRQ